MLKKIKKSAIKEHIPLLKLIPNVITIVGLITGVSSIRFALDERWEHSVCCIVIAAILDGIDGKVARLLNATSPFGGELDSLCDFANFGLCPAILIYLWSFQQFEFKLISWFVMLLFVASMAIRLARFNTGILLNKVDQRILYFSKGVPAPSGAILALIPIILDFDIGARLHFSIRTHTLFIDFYIVIMAFLLASRVPTFLLKNISIKPEYLWLFMISAALFIINLIIYPWYFIPFCAFLYLLSIPWAFYISKS